MTDQPASTAPLAAGLPLVKGRCPACGTGGLFLGDGGYITCSLIDCPQPDAATEVIADFWQARQHAGFTFCAQNVGHVTMTEFAKKITEKVTAVAQRASAVEYANEQLQRAEKAEAALARVRAARERIARSQHADAIYCLDVLDEALGITPPAPAATEATQTETTARVFAGLHHSAEQDVTRVINLYEQWVKAGPPPLGVPLSRWWDRHLVELHQAILPTAEQPERTTANNPATSGDAANNPLREQLADVLRPWLLGADEADVEHCAEAVLAVHRRETAQLRRERDMALKAAREARGDVAHDAGPSVAEAADNDRNWDVEQEAP